MHTHSKVSNVKWFTIYLTAGWNSKLRELPLQVGRRASEINELPYAGLDFPWFSRAAGAPGTWDPPEGVGRGSWDRDAMQKHRSFHFQALLWVEPVGLCWGPSDLESQLPELKTVLIFWATPRANLEDRCYLDPGITSLISQLEPSPNTHIEQTEGRPFRSGPVVQALD